VSVVTADQLVLFSTETGDAWLLDPSDHLAARLARDGDPETIAFAETDTTFKIAWPGAYVSMDRPSSTLIVKAAASPLSSATRLSSSPKLSSPAVSNCSKAVKRTFCRSIVSASSRLRNVVIGGSSSL
jgi:hypothetical protein